MTLKQAYALRALIEKAVQSLSDNDAIEAKTLYPPFNKLIGQTVLKGFRFTYDGKLWSTVQPELTIQAHYPPGVGMESLYEEVCETHEGTIDDPIPYEGNMTLELGKFYEQDGAIYECIRDSGNPVYHALNALLGLYVQRI